MNKPLYFRNKTSKYIESITRLQEDMDFMFEWQEKNIKSISLSCRVMFFLFYGHFECSSQNIYDNNKLRSTF